jgi:hypothetical protein
MYIIIGLIVFGIYFLWLSFRPERSMVYKCRKSYDALCNQILNCKDMKILNEIDDQLDDFYEHYHDKVPHDVLATMFKNLLNQIEYRKVHL